MPTVPTMTTAAKDTEYTITLSEPLGWLNVVENWNWMDIITWSDDKLSGTYSTKGLVAQPGYGTWANNQSDELVYNPFKQEWVKVDTPYAESYWAEWLDAEDVGYSYYWENFKHDDAPHWEGFGNHKEMAYGAGYFVAVPTAIYAHKWVDLDGEEHQWYGYTADEDYILSDEEDEELEIELWEKVLDAQDALIAKYEKLGDQDAVDYITSGYCGYAEYRPDGIVRIYDNTYTQSFGVYELDDDFAYDGATADGTLVRYGRYGELVRVGVTLTGVNFLGTDKTPTKTTVYWRPLEHKGKNVSNYYIFQITEEYEDGSKLNAHFSSSMGGKFLGSKAE
jgi:hypothetical protein